MQDFTHTHTDLGKGSDGRKTSMENGILENMNEIA